MSVGSSDPGPRLPTRNIYVISSADDLPQTLSQYVLYNLEYDPGDGIGLYYTPDGISLVRVASTVAPPVLPSVVQGDLLYGSAVDVISTLPKDTGTSRYLSNQGVGNDPLWDQVNLADGVIGDLGVGNLDGGTGATSATFWRGDGSWATPLYPPVFAGAGDDGLVPDPTTETGKYLKDDGTWDDPPGTAGVVYPFYVASGFGSGQLPSGWSVSSLSTGLGRVTHNLGLSSANDLSVLLTATGSGGQRNVAVYNMGVDSFDMELVDADSLADFPIFGMAAMNV